MEPRPTNARGTRLVLVGVGLFALLMIVAFASRAGFRTGGASSAPSQKYLDYAFSVFFVLWLLAIPVAAYAWYLRGQEVIGAGAFKRRPFLQTISIVLVFGVITYVVRRLHGLHGLNPFHRGRLGAASPKGGLHHPGATQVEPHFRWPVLVAFALLFVAAAVVYVVSRRRRRRRVELVLEDPAVRAELAQAISDAIDDLEAEPDARRAVIAAYARMEAVLARHGLPRRPSETPWEYLGRVLIDLRARAEPVRRLTSLFERAKFSRHEIDAPMKREAIGALVDIRDDLRTAVA
jgi:hypothetical protein